MWVYATDDPIAKEIKMNERTKMRWVRTTLPRETWVERQGVPGCIVGVLVMSTRLNEMEYRVETRDGIEIWRGDEFIILPTDESDLLV